MVSLNAEKAFAAESPQPPSELKVSSHRGGTRNDMIEMKRRGLAAESAPLRERPNKFKFKLTETDTETSSE